MKQLAFSSEFYFIKARDLKKLVVKEKVGADFNDDCIYLKLHHDGQVTVYAGKEKIDTAPDDDFVKTRIVYVSFPTFISFFLNIIKPIKRRFYIKSMESFRVRLADLLAAKLPRGERNAENAYQFNNRRYHLDHDEAQKCYNKLRSSIEKHGYDERFPMYVMLNRKFGCKDQLLQGHHRIGICKELNVKEVNIAFWAAPASFQFLRKFFKKQA